MKSEGGVEPVLDRGPGIKLGVEGGVRPDTSRTRSAGAPLPCMSVFAAGWDSQSHRRAVLNELDAALLAQGPSQNARDYSGPDRHILRMRYLNVMQEDHGMARGLVEVP